MTNYILIVEDDQNLAVTIEMLLDSEGYPSKIARNGREALDAIAEQAPALIILDMLMPVMDGWQFAHELKERHVQPPPILVLTAAECARARALEIQATAVMSKPFDMRQLLASINQLLGGNHAAHA
jgi:DNA-binding response OmpR family regulator